MEFEEYASTRWPALYRTALLLTGNTAEAEDLAQRTLVKVFAGWSKVSRADSPDAYVRRILVNELTTDRRRGARRAPLARARCRVRVGKRGPRDGEGARRQRVAVALSHRRRHLRACR